MSVNLFCKVGRSPKQCIGTFPDEVAANAAQGSKFMELLKEGNAPERIEFTREVVGAKPKKGK